jgi:uncharacterized RDD family membrane protein YckC
LKERVNDEQLHITGLTGVELNLSIAGPGSRSYAFLIDWHIRVLLAVAWMLAVWVFLKYAGLLGAGFRQHYAVLTFWPAVLIYLLYHPVLELLMRGHTPGKRMAGVRLVMRNGSTPGASAILIRNIFRIIDGLPFLYLVGLIACLVSAQRLRIGDMAAGTVLVLDGTRSSHAFERLPALVVRTGLDAELIELIAELLERWPSLGIEHRDGIARALLKRARPALAENALAGTADADLQLQLRAVLAP